MTERFLGGLIRSIVVRARLISSAFSAGNVRTAIQAQILRDEVKAGLELLLPYGMSALPLSGDLIVLAVGGMRDHQIALMADDPSLRIVNLAAGEFGYRDARGTQIVWRQDRLEVTTPLKLVATVTGDLDATVGGAVNLTATGAIALTSSASIDLNAPSIGLNGAVTQGTGSNGGAMTMQGPVTVNEDLVAAGISVSKHDHISESPGTPTSGPIG